MKKMLFIMLAMVCLYSVQAQGQGFQRKSPQERTDETMAKLADLKLDSVKAVQTKKIFLDFYTEGEKAMREMFESGEMNREKMMAIRKEMAEARDKKLEAVFSKEEMKKWKDDIEPGMRPQRRRED